MTAPREPARRDPTLRVPSDREPDERDPLGRMALFSSGEPEPSAARGGFIVECSSCLSETRVGAADLARAALPMSFHLPFVRRFHSFMRCPACGRRAWVRVRVAS